MIALCPRLRAVLLVSMWLAQIAELRAAHAQPPSPSVAPTLPTATEPAEPVPSAASETAPTTDPSTALAAPLAPPTPMSSVAPAAIPSRCSKSTVAIPSDPGDCLPRAAVAAEEVADVARLKTPESPALMMLGVAPSEIQRPTTPTGVALSIASGFANGHGLSPLRNFALVVAPYWLVPHPTVALERLQAEPEWAWLRNLSLSVASGDESIQDETDPSGAETELAKASAGVRFTLWPGHPSLGAKQCLVHIKTRMAELTLDASAKNRNFLTEYLVTHPEPARPPRGPDPVDPNDAEQVEAWRVAGLVAKQAFEREYAAWLERYEAARAEAVVEETEALGEDAQYQTCLRTIHAKAGFMAELAGAGLLSVPDADLQLLDKGGTVSSAGWLTFGYVADQFVGRRSEGSVLWVLRAETAKGSLAQPRGSMQRVDGGMRLALALHRAGVAVEGTARYEKVSSLSEAKWLYRASLSVDYRVDGGMWLSATFGKDFGDSSGRTPILALANVQWSFGLDRAVEIDRRALR